VRSEVLMAVLLGRDDLQSVKCCVVCLAYFSTLKMDTVHSS
jgi:hypothetical protein